MILDVSYEFAKKKIGREPEDDYGWEQIDSCRGEYYGDSDELIEDALEENGIKPKETAQQGELACSSSINQITRNYEIETLSRHKKEVP